MNFLFFVVVLSTALLALASGAAVLFALYATMIGFAMGAPYVRSKKVKIEEMMALARLMPGESAVDLGSGDGSVVIAASRTGASAVGVEMNPMLVWYSRMRLRHARPAMAGRARIMRGNFYNFSLRDMDVVFLYLWPSTVARLREKMERELKPGSRVISNAFPISGWTPTREDQGVFLYQIGAKN